MNHLRRFLPILCVALVAIPGLAGDFDDILKATKQVWPDKSWGAAVCSVDFNQLALLDLTDGAKEQGMSMLILNVKSPKELEGTLNLLLSRKPDFLVLIEDDPSLGEKNRAMSTIVGRAGARKIPTVGLTEESLKYGALMAMGPGTGGKLLVNGKVAKDYKITVPEGAVIK
jgi:ABC-type uncharacterized transport system substrate-binding protein